MNNFENFTLREVEPSDLDTFYHHQLDPEAITMAAFVSKDPQDKVTFHAHWDKILSSSQITKRTIVADGQVAGHISCYPDGDHMEVTSGGWHLPNDVDRPEPCQSRPAPGLHPGCWYAWERI